jgi:hypothetical protein
MNGRLYLDLKELWRFRPTVVSESLSLQRVMMPRTEVSFGVRPSDNPPYLAAVRRFWVYDIPYRR